MKFFYRKYGENKAKKISTAQVKELIGGKEKLKEFKESALEIYNEDPLTEISWMVNGGILIAKIELR